MDKIEEPKHPEPRQIQAHVEEQKQKKEDYYYKCEDFVNEEAFQLSLLYFKNKEEEHSEQQLNVESRNDHDEHNYDMNGMRHGEMGSWGK